jgi:hypothetical protein
LIFGGIAKDYENVIESNKPLILIVFHEVKPLKQQPRRVFIVRRDIRLCVAGPQTPERLFRNR